MPNAQAAQQLSVAASPRFGGYSPKRLVKTTLANFVATADYTADGCTLSADTTNWLCNDGVHFAGVKHTHTSGQTASATKRTFAAPINLTGKQLGLRFYLHPGTAGGADDARTIYYMHLVLKSAAGGKAYRFWYRTELNEYPAGWQTVYITTNCNEALYGQTGTFDIAAVTAAWVVMWMDANAIKTPSVTLDELFAVTPPAQPYAAFAFESCYGPVMQVAGYLESLGLRGNFAMEPNRLVGYFVPDPPNNTPYVTLAQARQLRAAGHFIYMYLATLHYYPTGQGTDDSGGLDKAWGLTAEVDKPRKIHFCREELTKMGLIDDCGSYVAAIRGVGWDTADDANIIGKEILYVPGNTGCGVNRLSSMDEVYGKPGAIGSFHASDAANIAKAAAANALYIPMWHCINATDAALCMADIDLCVSSGFKFITFRDLMTGNI